MNRTVALRLDGSHELGLGHVKRCLAIADELARRKQSPVLILRHADDAAIELIRAAGRRAVHLSGGFEREASALAAHAETGFDALVLDISHPETFRQADRLPRYFEELRRRFAAIAVIDGCAPQCLASRFDLPVDLVVIPYVGAETQAVRNGGAHLALGPAYFVIDGSYSPYLDRRRPIAKQASRLLITAGGGDSAGITTQVLTALEGIQDRRLSVRVVVGPAYASPLVRAIEGASSASRHRITLVDRPESLAPHMAWCDLSVATSGLTKYELAATGTPAVLISIDRTHETLNRSFERFGTARHLGRTERIAAADLRAAIIAALDDVEARRAMSRAGQSLLDGKGLTRVVDALMALIETTAAAGDHAVGTAARR